MRRPFQFIAALAAMLPSGAAMAHVGFHSAGGFTAGYTHPFVGLDHLLAMVAVGLWAVQLGGRYLFLVPATFVLAMAVGAAVGAAGIALPQVESMVAASVLVLGALVALSTRAAWYWAVALVAAFGLFHGHAHGTEMPDFAAPWQYFIGFAIATASLHAVGLAGGIALKNYSGMVRAGGTAIGLIGAWLVLSI